MDRYIHQLIGDLKEAIELLSDSEILFINDEFENEEEDDELSLAFIEHNLLANQTELGKIVGMDQVLLPPVEKLSKPQAATLFPYIENLLSGYGFELDFPNGVPQELKYELVRQAWTEKFGAVNAGVQMIEFCDYDSDYCPFGSELCQCKEFEKMCT